MSDIQTPTKIRKSIREVQHGDMRASYDVTRTTDNNVNQWAGADGLSANAALNPWTRRIARNRARYEFANNSYCYGVVNTICNDLVGCGPTIRFNAGDEGTNRILDRAYEDWSRAIRFPDKLRRLCISKIVDGEAFGILQSNFGLRSKIKLDVRLVEADQFASSVHNVFDEDDGIVRDDFGNVLSYNLYKYHPGSTTGYSLESSSIPARQVCHWFRATRPSQSRGMSELAPALPLFSQLRSYTLSALSSAERASDVSLVYKSNSSLPEDTEISAFSVVDIERNQAIVLPDEWEISQIKAEQPTTGFKEFRDAILREVGRCLQVPCNVILGDSSGYNYSSSRLDHRTYYTHVGVDRSDIYHEILHPVLEDWFTEAKVVYNLQHLGDLPEVLVGWPIPPSIDPFKDAKTAELLIDAGLLTEKEYHASRGMDHEEVERQRATELGITVEQLRDIKRSRLLNSSIAPLYEDEEKPE